MGRDGFLPYMTFALNVLIVISNCNGLSAGRGDSLSMGASLNGNQTIISKNGTFELGFFSPDGSNNWYMGIWYANMQEKIIVWVANRESPSKNSAGLLKLSKEGNLELFDAQGTTLWSVNISRKPSRVVLLDSGNFLMLSDDNKSETVWQSFDYPVDTLLPGMRIGGQQRLTCWKSSLDSAPGLFSNHLDPSGAKQFVLTWNNSVQYWESGHWDGQTFSGIPKMTKGDDYNISFESTSSGLYFSYNFPKGITRFLQIKSGRLQEYTLFEGAKWTIFATRPGDQCAVYGLCGAYGSCNSNNLQFCTCVEGFTPADNRAWDSQEWWSSGCVRQSPLNCGTDEFIDLSVTSYPDSDWSHPAPTKEDCQQACLRNCSCSAFAFNYPSGPCQIWSGDLLNIQNSPSNSRWTLSIRVAASAHHKGLSFKFKATSIVSSLAVVLSIFSFVMWKRYRLQPTFADSSDSFLRTFTYMELKTATKNFRSKLGGGGFGSVFKGSLTDGTLVAVKKLEGSRQHDKQFLAEISSLGNIQHANLIRLRGFCAEGSKRLLVYDYMPNGSLNSLLFTSNSKSKGKVLDWKTRFQIALGTARGLVYLHEECRDRIIHGDIKPENILLDDKFSPRSLDFNVKDSSQYYFPPWAATQICQGKMINIVDEGVAVEADIEEVSRASVVGLLCIERDEEVRPSMGQVVRMLEGKVEAQTPKLLSSAIMDKQADRSDTS
ncbi:hypothetical protein SUGI_0543600 [Cryptomeria japonica]|nr:hypothetical protein SUGI_0543600 [Cryptomeria japonica]